MAKKGRSTVYNNITSEEKLKQVNQDNLDLEEDYLDYLRSVDRAKTTIYQYQQNLRVFWCWNLEFNKNKFFVDLTKREISKSRFEHMGLVAKEDSDCKSYAIFFEQFY